MPVALLIIFLLLLCLFIRKVNEFQCMAQKGSIDRFKEGYEASGQMEMESPEQRRESRARLILELERKLAFELTQPVKDWLLADEVALDTASILDAEEIRAIQEPFELDFYHGDSRGAKLYEDDAGKDAPHGLDFLPPIRGCLYHSEQGCGIHTLVIVNPPELAGRIVHIGYCPIFLSGHIQDSVP